MDDDDSRLRLNYFAELIFKGDVDEIEREVVIGNRQKGICN